MFNWSTINTTYLYDGTFNGLLTIVFDSYVSKTIPEHIVSNSVCLSLFQNYVTVKTDDIKADRIYHGIVHRISYATLYHAYHVFLSNVETKEMDILRYLLLGFEIGNKIDHLLSNPLVLSIQKTAKRVFGEAHRLTGLLRFIQIDDNMYYSKIHPDNNVIEIIGNHFIKRLPCQNFIIHDKNRNIAFLYNTKTYTIVDAKDIKISSLSQEEKEYQALWKTFYQHIGIKERTNKRLQMQYMPKKYWQDLIEKQL